MRITIVSTLAAGYIAFGGIADAGGFTMVKDGVGKCVLVTSGKLSPSEETAVKEFKQLVAEMSGAQLASQGIQEAEGQPKIVIGKEAVTKLYPKVELSGLGEEGFIIKQQGQDLLVAGGALRGTMYGLYTLLENLGCRWLAEDENFIPKKKTLEVSLTDSRQVPVLEQRNIMYAGTSGAWSAHNKINRPGWDTIEDKYGGTFATAGPQAHDLFLLMEEAGVKVADDMQCVWEGKRENAQLCVTDPRVIDAFTKALIKIAKSKPSVPYVQLMMEDNKKYCQCDRCKAIDAKAESHAGQTVYCVNQIAKVLAREVPGTDLMFGAYLATRTPPKNTVLESNVVVQLALIESNYMRPLADGHVEANRKGLEDIVAWGKLAEKIFIWDYVVNFDHYNMMFPNLDVLTPNVKFYVDHRARHIMEQAAHTGKNAEFFQLRRWVLAKALWNPEADNQELISDFLTHYYGPAGPAIQEYIDVIHKPARTTVFEFTSRLNAPYLKPEIIAAAEVAMQKADKLAKGDPTLERRVRHAHLPVWYVIAHRSPGGPTWEAVQKATGKPIDLVHIAGQTRQILGDAPDNKYMAYADHEPIQPWVEWLQDYAALVANNGGKQPLPPELKGVDPKTYKLTQACQMDSRSRWWQKSEGASDGWACKVPTPGWTVLHYLMLGEDFLAGRKYEIYVRVKPGKLLAKTGNAFVIGDFKNQIHSYSPQPDWDVARFKGDGWQVVKIGQVKDTDTLYFAANPSVMSEYELDCYWLKQILE